MQVNREELIGALKIVKPGLAKRELIEQSTSFAFLGDRVVTYNDEVSISHPVHNLTDLKGAVNAEELFNLLERISKEDIEITIGDSTLNIKSGRIKSALALKSEIVLPIEEIQGKKNWHQLPEGFVEAIKHTAYSCSKDPSSPALTCIHMNGTLTESSDNVRLAQYYLDESVPGSPFLLPGTSARTLLKYPIEKIAIGTKSDDAPANQWSHFLTSDGTTLSCRLLATKYPNTSKATKATDGMEITMPPRMIKALDRAEVFADRPNEIDEEVEIRLVQDKITVRAHSETGWVEEDLRIKYDGEDISFAVHPTLLKKICDQKNRCVISKSRMRFSGDNWVHILSLKVR